MRTIAITTTSFLALFLRATAELPEEPARQNSAASSASAAISIDRDGRKETRIINLKNGSASLKLERDFEEKAEPKTWLGVVLNEVAPSMASQLPIDPGTGLIVEHVTLESPAAKAGLQKHDVLVRLGDQVLIAPKQLQTLVSNRKAGDTVEIALLRKGQPQTITATLATHQPSDGLGDHEATINLRGTKIDLDRLIKDAHDTAGSIILNKKTVFVGPDGKPVTIDSDEIRDRTLRMLEKSGLTREIIDQVKGALSEAQEQVRKAQEQAKEAAHQVRKASEQAQSAAERAVKELENRLEKTPDSEPRK